MSEPPVAPAWQTSQWFNTGTPLDLASLRGRVVVLHAFQMLCPGCVLHGVPQAERIHQQFAREGVTVVGRHTVFEHHAAMQPVSLAAFLHEFRVTHPVGVDVAVPGQRIPATMQAHAMQGTPTLVLIDRAGHIRRQHFGRLDDMTVGAEVMRLVRE
ncbi:redoxin family protein [Sinimarinibacterium thermocellulolyticum]|uniref:Redoxin family protein n=1 Tax=Sinimarinibacterium thermocellulolyticum TaxID=3170016 RepID=A0ABV2A9S6_9GAMM